MAIRVMWLSSVIGLSTVTVMGTEYPFSAMGGNFNETPCSLIARSPKSSLIADCILAGAAVARMGETGIDRVVATPKPNNDLRFMLYALNIRACLQYAEIGDYIFDALGCQSGLIFILFADLIYPVDAVI